MTGKPQVTPGQKSGCAKFCLVNRQSDNFLLLLIPPVHWWTCLPRNQQKFRNQCGMRRL